MIVWFEVDDLFVHFDWNLHPTGIQRVALAIMQAAHARQGDRIAFCSFRDGDYDIYTVRPDGSDVRKLTNSP